MPLIGAQGPGSNISWRGNLDEYPDEFIFPEVIEVRPGDSGISTAIITGINYKALVTAVGSGCSVRITPYDDNTQTYGSPGDFLPGNDQNNPVIIRNNDKVELKISTNPPTQRSDYNRNYPVDVTIGKRPTSSWSITTKVIDDDPDPFGFTNQNNLQINSETFSNSVTVTGIDDVIGCDIFIASATGELRINGGSPARSGKIFDGDTLDLVNSTSNFYSTPVTTTVQIGIFTADFTIETRPADTTVDDFNFTPVSDVDLNTTHISNSITLSGADENLNGNNPLPISISNGEYRIERNGSTVQDFTSTSGETQNGDTITLRVTASDSYSTASTATVTISNRTKEFTATTRARPVNTIPNQFTFNDRVDVDRQSTVTSNTITLSGMTDFGDEGTATISSASGVEGKFKVVRNGVTVRNYSNASYGVRNGDQITLQLKASPNSLGVVSATFTISGTNTFNVVSGVPGSTTDTWNVTAKERFCNITSFSLANRTGNSGGLQPGQTASTSFIATGFDFDCGMTVTTSNANSYLKIGSRQGTSLSNVQIDDVVEVYMVAPYYDESRTTTVTLTSSYGTSRTANWTISPVSPPLPTLTLDAQNRSVPFIFPDGGTAVLTYTYNFVTNSSVTTNFGLSSISKNTLSSGQRSGTRTITGLQSGSNTFTMTVTNSSGSRTDSVTVLVGTPPNPTITLCPSNTSSCSSTSNSSGSTTLLYWKTTNAVTTSSPDFNTSGKQNGSVTVNNTTDNKTYRITATGAGNNPPTATATHTINLLPSVNLSSNRTNIITGQSITLSWTSSFANRVVNTSGSGFNTSSLSGSLTLTPPRGTTTYGITVGDGTFNASDTVTVRATDDTVVDNFSMSPSSVTNVNRSSNNESQPVFTNGGNRVSGLSPGVTLTARVSNGVFTSGGTSKSISNGTAASNLRIRVTASNSYSTTKTATLTIGSKSANFSVRTEDCVVERSTSSFDGVTVNTIRGVAAGFNDLIVVNVRSGGSTAISRAGNGQRRGQTFGPGLSQFTTPPSMTTMTATIISAGGGGGSASSSAGGGGGGGAAMRSIWAVAKGGGTKYDIVVGRGGGKGQGGASGADGGTSFIRSIGAPSGTVQYMVTFGGKGGGTTRGGSGGTGGGTNFTQPPVNGANGGDRRGSGRLAGGGHGGGAARYVGGTCLSGSNCGSSSFGGGAGQGSRASNSKCFGDNCRKGSYIGNDGVIYGGGGGGGSAGLPGGTGAVGNVRIDWVVDYPTPPKQDVIHEIIRTFWREINRGPTVSELQAYYNRFKNEPEVIFDVFNIRGRFESSIKSIGSVSNITDNCGNSLSLSV